MPRSSAQKNTGETKSTSQASSAGLAVQFARAGHLAVRYRVILFVLFVSIIYAVVVWHINSYSDLQPSQTVEDSKIPHIDKNMAEQLTQLKNNHVRDIVPASSSKSV